MLVVFQRCLPFFLPCLKKKVTNIFIAWKRPKTHISPTEKVVNEHEKMLARVHQGCTTAVHTCEKHCRLLVVYTPENINDNFSCPRWFRQISVSFGENGRKYAYLFNLVSTRYQVPTIIIKPPPAKPVTNATIAISSYPIWHEGVSSTGAILVQARWCRLKVVATTHPAQI